MKDSDLLIKVRGRIVKGSSWFICTALTSIQERNPNMVSETQVDSLIHWITTMLGHNSRGQTNPSLQYWLDANHQELSKGNHRTPYTSLNLKKLRLKWLDWMINECQKREID